MKRALVIIITLCHGWMALAQEAPSGFDFGKDTLSDKWFAGPALVYDCEDKHWVCASPFNHVACEKDRQTDLKIGKHELRCLPATIFEGTKECHIELARLMKQGAYPRLCLHPKIRHSFIGFR